MVKARVVIIDAEGSDEALRALVAALQSTVAPPAAAIAAPTAPLALSAPVTDPVTPPRRVVRRPKRPAARPAAAAPVRARRTEEATPALDQTRAFFIAQKRPVTRKDVIDAVKAPMHQVLGAIDALVDAGTIVRRGERRGLRLGRPDVMTAADPEGD